MSLALFQSELEGYKTIFFKYVASLNYSYSKNTDIDTMISDTDVDTHL